MHKNQKLKESVVIIINQGYDALKNERLPVEIKFEKKVE